MDRGHWQFDLDFNPQEWVGFIYVIINKATGSFYYGKKFFQNTTRRRQPNKINRRKIIKESNWKKYTGSSKKLNEDIETLGKENFIFEILSLHESRSSLAYSEIKMIVMNDGLLDNKCYNMMLPPIKYKVKAETEREREYKR